MRFTFLLSCLLAFAPPLPAKFIPPALPLALEQCSSMISKLYKGRLPYSQLGEAVVRDKVECTTGFTKPAQVVHHEHVQSRYSAQEQRMIKTSMATRGRQNPMVKGLCEQSGYTSLLAFVDLSYRFYLDGVELGEVRVSADMCSSG